ncbi:hypothetical protein JCM10450v2_007111 [Rhodotorula kratochvilovae]
MPPSLQFDPSEPRDWHYLSAIPLAPASPLQRTSFSPPTMMARGASVGAALPPLPPQPDRPDVPCTPQLNSTPTMGGAATFPSEHLRDSPTYRTGSPQRPPRPLNPDRALMFNAPLPPLPLEAAYDEGEGEDLHVSHLSPSSAETSPHTAAFPAPPSHAYSHGELLPPAPLSPSPRSPQRKPVPTYLPEIASSTPISLSRTASPSPEGDLRDGGRLSVGGFEALLARRAETGHGVEEDPDGHVVWSPRMQLGLDPEGVEAREARRRWDQQRLRAEVEEQELGDLSASHPATPPRRTLAPHPPAEHILVSPRGTRARVRQLTVEDLSSPAQGASPRSPRSITGWLRGHGPGAHRRFLSVDDGADADVRAVHAGPQLRRGSKRLSELSSVSASIADVDEKYRREAATPGGAEASQRRSPTGSGRHASLHSTPSSRSVLRRGESRYGAGGRKTRTRSEGKVAKDQFEVVVLDPRETEPIDLATDGDWERVRTETTCRPERMDWSMCDFEGGFPRLLHLLYPFAIFAHIPATLFLDYNLVYLLCQLARYPAVPSPTSRNIAMRALVDVPDIRASTGWWVAVATYAACTAAWFFGVFLWKELGREFFVRWKRGDRSVEIEKVYAGAASFNLACLRSYSHFSFFWRIRLAPFRPSSAIAQSVEGTSWTDGIHETASWYRQNWPTLLLLLPRAGLAVAVLLLYSTTAYGTSTSTTGRDTAYFGGDGTLTGFASGVLFANAAWAAWRLVVWLVAVLAVAAPRLSSIIPRRRPSAYSDYYHASQMHISLALPDSPIASKGTPVSSRRPSVMYATWRTRRQRRIRSAILACLGSTPLSTSSATFSPILANSPYVLGYAAKKARGAHADDNLGGDVQVLRVEHDHPHRRASMPAPHSTTPDPRGSPLASYRQLLSTLPHHSPPPPQQQISPSPLIHFSPATPSPPRFNPPPLVAGQTTGAQPRRTSIAAGGDGLTGGDVGESFLHRRMRSLPQDQDNGLIVFPPSSANLSPRSYPALSAARPAAAQLYASVGESKPRQLLPPIMTSPRPPLVSHFSAFSSKHGSTAASTPLTERNPNLRPEASRTSSSSPSPPHPPAAGDENRSALLQAHLAAGQAERTRLSQRLYDEVQRAQEEEDARSDEERRAAGLRRGSEAATSFVGGQSFATAPESHAGTDDARWSQLSSVGGHSDSSTVRGGAAPALVPAAPLGTPPAEDDERDSEETSTPEHEGPVVAQSRIPVRFSRASGTESLAISAYNSPDLTGGDESGQFEGATPMMGRSRST